MLTNHLEHADQTEIDVTSGHERHPGWRDRWLVLEDVLGDFAHLRTADIQLSRSEIPDDRLAAPLGVIPHHRGAHPGIIYIQTAGAGGYDKIGFRLETHGAWHRFLPRRLTAMLLPA